MPLPLALTCTVPAFTLAVITDAVVAFALVRLLVAVFVFLVVALIAMVTSNQNVTRLNTGQRAHG